ncbi:hypothetical protein [Planctomicrobium piriforme]|nr:hypothetical protein [Planctomicrobium piriforme]
MQIDGSTAPVASGPPAIYGQLLGAGVTGAAPAKTTPASTGAPAQPSNSVPSGCVSNDPAQQRLDALSQQIAQLNAAVSQLSAMQQRQAVSAGRTSQPQASQLPIERAAYEQAIYEREVSLKHEAQQRQLQDQFVQKCQELERMQAQMDEMQVQYKQVLEQRLSEVSQQRNERLRQKLDAQIPAGASPAQQPPRIQPVRQPVGNDAFEPLPNQPVVQASGPFADSPASSGLQPEWMSNGPGELRPTAASSAGATSQNGSHPENAPKLVRWIGSSK